MKAFLATISIISLLVLFTGCSKVNQSTVSNPGNIASLVGNWQWNISVTGWGGTSIPGVDTTVILSFLKDSTYSIKLNSLIKYSGRFSTTATPEPNSYIIITFPTHMSVANLRLYQRENVNQNKNDTLYLYDADIPDGSYHLFTLKK